MATSSSSLVRRGEPGDRDEGLDRVADREQERLEERLLLQFDDEARSSPSRRAGERAGSATPTGEVQELRGELVGQPARAALRDPFQLLR